MDLRFFIGALFKRWWALLSSAVLTLLGVYALATNRSNSWVVSSTLVAAVAMLLVASALAWNDEHKKSLALEDEVKRLNLVPAQFKISPIELRRNDPSTTKKRNIFVLAKVELISPAEVDVYQYILEFSKDGIVEELEAGNDVGEWILYVMGSPKNESMRARPKKFRSGQGAEGWVHFLTARSNYELDAGRLRLSVNSSAGDGHVEIPCASEYWNPTRTTIVMPRL